MYTNKLGRLTWRKWSALRQGGIRSPSASSSFQLLYQAHQLLLFILLTLHCRKVCFTCQQTNSRHSFIHVLVIYVLGWNINNLYSFSSFWVYHMNVKTDIHTAFTWTKSRRNWVFFLLSKQEAWSVQRISVRS